jgi:ribonucleoside-diphosphate reductase alpha chain
LETSTLTPERVSKDDALPEAYKGLGHHELNAMLNLYGPDGKMQFEADREAARRYCKYEVNGNTWFFHNLAEKLEFLVKEKYYEPELLAKYDPAFIKALFKQAYAHKFRFETFLGAFKFYTSYAMKTFDGKRFLERYEDRVTMVALGLADGDEKLASKLVDEIISGRFQPATPTFLNAGKKQRGELVSCFLLRIEDNMESIGRSINSVSSWIWTTMPSSLVSSRTRVPSGKIPTILMNTFTRAGSKSFPLRSIISPRIFSET